MTNPYQTIVARPKGYKQPEKSVLLLSLANSFTLEMCFHIIQSEQITLSTDITDHIVEDHTSVQDHITIKPRTFTLKGLISEKVYVHPDSIDIDLPSEPITAKLAKLAVLAPTMSSYVTSAINAVTSVANKAASIGKKAMNAAEALLIGAMKGIMSWAGYKPMINIDLRHKRWSDNMLQMRIIEVLDYYRTHRLPLKLCTGWGNEYDNLYITDITVNQGDTYQQSDLSITVKELRFTSIKMAKVTNEDLRNLQQSQEMNDTVTGQNKNSSWVYRKFFNEG